MKLKDVIPHNPDVRTYQAGAVIPNDSLVGVEVELEAFKGNPGDLTYWEITHDGSLREGGVEFVLSQPLTGYDLECAVTELYEKVLSKCTYKNNQRTSTHVHIDVRDISVEHLRRIVFIYSMVERFIYDMCTPDREYSFYCTPLYRSVQNRKKVASSLQSYEFGQCPKYSGINLKTIRKYGSLEFRMHQGINDSSDLKRWIMLLMKLRSGTKMYEDVPLSDILDMYSENSAEHIMEQVFGEALLENVNKNIYNTRLKESMRSAQDMLLLSKSGTVAKMERSWLSAIRCKNDNLDIDPEILEVLRRRQSEILEQENF